MCGLAGVVDRANRPVAPAVVAAMAARLAHRGPDGEGVWTDGPVGLGHRRLAIIDLSSRGQQPMHSDDGALVIVYNGEVYNFPELRTELEARGYCFRSRTDSEVVLKAYHAWGPQAVDRFNGMFAFAVWDRRHRRLFLARDRYGIKPLYYYLDGQALVFASEVKALLQHPAVPRRLSYPALNEYFTFQNIFSDRTFLEGVRVLPAGSYMTYDMAGDAEPVITRYWDYRFPETPLSCSREECAEELYRLFVQAVTRQLVSDVPVGSYLSGGMDSGSVTSVAANHIDHLKTFTCGFDLSSATGLELVFDERAGSEVLSNAFKTEHYEVVLHAGQMEDSVPELTWALDEPRLGQSYPNYFVARLASRFVRVVLSGGAGDELFAGYPWRYYRGLGGNGTKDYHQSYYGYWQRLVSEADKPQLFNDATLRRIDGHSTFDVFRSVFDGWRSPLDRREDYINASLYFELKTFLHGLLIVEDKISMAHSLETRVPFLDNDLVDFALAVPINYKLANLENGERVDENEPGKVRKYRRRPNADGKAIFREAMRRIIPPETAQRPKQGFSGPDASWFRGESVDYVSRLLRDPQARVNDFLRPAYIDRILNEHESGAVNHRLLIWSFLSFEWWCRKFLD